MKFYERLFCALLPSEGSRMRYIRSKRLFKKLGNNVIFVPRILPVEPEYIIIGNNVIGKR